VLVGHSYDGIVITNAAYNNKNVTGLVYVAALAPDEDQFLGDFFDITKLPKENISFCSKIEQWSLSSELLGRLRIVIIIYALFSATCLVIAVQ
jgi:pimeloyl-ACP methyl ester carboxylesterase